MSGDLECPACRVREVYGADGVTVILRDPACTGRESCARKLSQDEVNALLDFSRDQIARARQSAYDATAEHLDALDDLIGFSPQGRAALEAARAREARIQAARDKVLAEVRRWRRERPDFCGGGTNLLGAAADAWLAAEAEGETP